jgi:hypothetical protein
MIVSGQAVQDALALLRLHVGDAEAGIAKMRVGDRGGTRQRLRRAPARGVPQARANERLRAVREDLLGGDDERTAGRLADRFERSEQIGVVIEELEADAQDHPSRGAGGELTRIDALIWVETESQKAIVVGHAGRMIKAIGTAARRELENELGGRVHLSLIVRVRRHWRADDGLLDRLGIE